MISLIAAFDKNFTIGNKGTIPWKLSQDLKFFKEQTLNNPIIMGRKTFDSIKRVLPNRINIVLSRSSASSFKKKLADASVANVSVADASVVDLKNYKSNQYFPGSFESNIHKIFLAPDLDTAISFAKDFNREIFIIGGQTLYEKTITLADRLYLTMIEQEFEGDTLFPTADLQLKWIKFFSSKPLKENDIVFKFTIWERKNK